MVDLDTFVTLLYVEVDDYCKAHLPPEPRHGHPPSLCRSEVITLAVLGQWSRFGGERRFYAEATRRLRSAFPQLPHRSQYNRLVRQHGLAIQEVALGLAASLDPCCAYEVLDTTGVVTRDCRRRGPGWLGEAVDKGRCTRVGWYVGFRLLTAVTPHGAITGYCTGRASTNDRHLADVLLQARHGSSTLPIPEAGTAHAPRYLADGGFWGPRVWQARWRSVYHSPVLAPPQQRTRYHAAWSRQARRWLASHRQIIETVHDRLLHTGGLVRERPHVLSGFRARLAAKIGLHNFCLLLNQRLGRPLLAVADLIDW
jgi:hypothetical protein